MINNNREHSFIEVYNYWQGYGNGLMLCYVGPYTCEYVSFTKANTNIREVINKDLLDKYSKEE